MKTIRSVGLMVTLSLVAMISAMAADADRLDRDTGDAMQMFRNSSERMQRRFDTAYGYAIFPSVGKSAIGIGGAEGQGQVYEKGVLVGTAKLTQVTIGAQLGAQSYAEVIFFEGPKALDDFREGKTALSAGISAVAAGEGTALDAKYQHGVLVYTMGRNGLMFEASVGGQHFAFTPLAGGSVAPPSPRTAPPESTAPSTPPAPPATSPTSPSDTPAP